MTDHPTLRPGMRARLTIEGEVHRDRGLLCLCTPGGEHLRLRDINGDPYTVLRMATVEVLADPRPGAFIFSWKD